MELGALPPPRGFLRLATGTFATSSDVRVKRALLMWSAVEDVGRAWIGQPPRANSPVAGLREMNETYRVAPHTIPPPHTLLHTFTHIYTLWHTLTNFDIIFDTLFETHTFTPTFTHLIHPPYTSHFTPWNCAASGCLRTRCNVGAERSGHGQQEHHHCDAAPIKTQLCLLNHRVLPVQFVGGLNRGWPTPLRRGGLVLRPELCPARCATKPGLHGALEKACGHLVDGRMRKLKLETVRSVLRYTTSGMMTALATCRYQCGACCCDCTRRVCGTLTCRCSCREFSSE